MWCVSFSSLARPSSFGPSSFLIERYLEFSSSGALTERHFALSLCDGGVCFKGTWIQTSKKIWKSIFLKILILVHFGNNISNCRSWANFLFKGRWSVVVVVGLLVNLSKFTFGFVQMQIWFVRIIQHSRTTLIISSKTSSIPIIFINSTAINATSIIITSAWSVFSQQK